MSLVTTVVVFVASMVLGECRQMSSSSQVGNDSFLLQVSPEHLLPSSCAYKKKNPEMYDMLPFQANGCVGFEREECVVGFLPERECASSVSFTSVNDPGSRNECLSWGKPWSWFFLAFGHLLACVVSAFPFSS